MKTNLVKLFAVVVAIAAPAASAHEQYGQRDRHEVHERERFAKGHYENRPVQRWVQGAYVQVTLPGHCRYARSWERCRPGGTITRWVPGHFETVMEAVWVGGNTPRGVGFQVMGRR